MHSLKRKKYDNIKMVDSDNHFMCYINKKRANWYLEKNLACVMQKEPLVIKLNFKPKSNTPTAYAQAIQNKCVICGSKKRLTNHHVVPYGFRQYMLKTIKSNNHHDILLLCKKCHKNYEVSADRFKEAIYKEYNVINGSRHSEEDRRYMKVKSSALALLRFSSQIPEERILELKKVIKDFFGDDSEESMQAALELKEKSYKPGKEIVKSMNESEMEDLVKRWRKHFLNYAQKVCKCSGRPPHFPELWDVNFSKKTI